MGTRIRKARDDDSWDLIGLVAGCWSEYPGCVLDIQGEEPDLLAVASAYAARNGQFWVVEDKGRLVGSVGLVPATARSQVVLEKLYVARSARRKGLGSRLVDLVETEAMKQGATSIELWSDTRFEPAHRLYERLGYVRNGATRELFDLSNSVEYHYRKELRRG